MDCSPLPSLFKWQSLRHLHQPRGIEDPLLNTPRPGELARWGLSLHIHYRPGPKNSNADALSHYPVIASERGPDGVVQVATLQPDVAAAKGGDRTMSKCHEEDPALTPIQASLRDGRLPTDKDAARRLVLEGPRYCLLNEVLYWVGEDGTLRLVSPTDDHHAYFLAVHAGKFGGHLCDKKVNSQLHQDYWWSGMRRDGVKWCHACRMCASREVGQPIQPPLVPLPMAESFDKVGVDVIQFVRSNCNQYAIVFIDYLTKWVEVFVTQDKMALTIAHLLVTECDRGDKLSWSAPGVTF